MPISLSSYENNMLKNNIFARSNFDERKIDVILMYFFRQSFGRPKFHIVLMYLFDAIAMNGKLKQLRRAYFDVLLKDKIWLSF